MKITILLVTGLGLGLFGCDVEERDQGVFENEENLGQGFEEAGQDLERSVEDVGEEVEVERE